MAAGATEVLVEYSKVLCIRGYHVYKDLWAASIGEMLLCIMDQDNSHDRFTVAVEKDGTVISHLPRKVSRVCSILEGRRKYSLYCDWMTEILH